MSGNHLLPGSTIGIIGGGQLGRMLAMAAARLGYRTLVLDPDADAPAARLADKSIAAAYDDPEALDQLAREAGVVTYEFENVPVQAIERLEKEVPVRPGSKALRIAQDRLAEKRMAQELGAGTAKFAAVHNRSDLDTAMKATGLPAVLKTVRFGYDGKGQARIANPNDADAAFTAINGQSAVLESFVNFDCEVSILVARGIDGDIRAFDLVENVHKNHILHTSTVPARLDAEAAKSAVETASAIAAHLDYVGVLAVEFFAVADGDGHRLLVNEIAPRVHNSGHWSEAACVVSQFEQHIRAICGLPLVDPARHTDCVMENLIGDDIDRLAELAAETGTFLHLYGKKETRPGRKMGHVTRLGAPAGRNGPRGAA